MPINFPSSPTNGDTLTVNGRLYTYVSSKQKWTALNVKAFYDAGNSAIVGNVPENYDAGTANTSYSNIVSFDGGNS